MGNSTLTINLTAIAANWRALDALSGPAVQTAAVVKANSYGLGANRVAVMLAKQGVVQFFVALASEGAALRKTLGPGPDISVFSGHMAGDTDLISDQNLTPMLNSPKQLERHRAKLMHHPYGIQLDTGMGRLGMQPSDWAELDHAALQPTLVMSHLACADEPEHPMNAQQLNIFKTLTDGHGFQRSLSATGGILLGPDYHFDLTRPGIGLYGGMPFTNAAPVVTLSLPVIQTRTLAPGDSVGYGNTWITKQKTRVATLPAGYADGVLRALSNGATLYHGDTPCPLIGRVSMDLITVDVTHLSTPPTALDILCAHQTPDQLAEQAGTIGYEVLTSLGARYERRYKDA